MPIPRDIIHCFAIYFIEMIRYFVTFVLVLHLPSSILSIECWTCLQELKLNSSEHLNISAPDCSKKEEPGQRCVGTLFIDYQKNTANLLLSAAFDQVLFLSNRNRMTTNVTMIWFDKDKAGVSLQSTCNNHDLCIEDVNKTYSLSKFNQINQKKNISERLLLYYIFSEEL